MDNAGTIFGTMFGQCLGKMFGMIFGAIFGLLSELWRFRKSAAQTMVSRKKMNVDNFQQCWQQCKAEKRKALCLAAPPSNTNGRQTGI